MRTRRAWLLVVLPAVGGIVAFTARVLWKVGENVGNSGGAVVIGAVSGLLIACVLMLWPGAQQPR